MAEAAARQVKDASWIYNPWIDLIVGCGAWTAPLILLSYGSHSSSMFAWSVAFYFLALLFNYPHYMATLYRAYHTAEDFNKYRIFTVHITGLVLLTVLLTHLWPQILPWIFTLYLTWSPWHYSGQNYGILMMFARRSGANPSSLQGRALYSAFLLSYGILFVSFHTGASNDALFKSLGIPDEFASLTIKVLGAAFAICATCGLFPLIRQVGVRKMLPSLTVLLTQFLWFLLPTALHIFRGMEVPQTRYSSGLLAVMHSAQYLWITSYYAKREAVQGWRPLKYFAALAVGGIALFIPGPWLASYVFHFDFAASFLIFTALVNLHHFILDGAIWKLRDGRIAALLLSPQRQVAETASEIGGRVAAAGRWMVGPSAAPKIMRVAGALILVGLAALDQIRFAKASDERDLGAMHWAATLNPFDSSLQMRIARSELEIGKKENAEIAFTAAVNANHWTASPRNSLLKYLLQSGQYEKAYAFTSSLVSHDRQDPDLLVNHGILAAKLGHPEEAMKAWSDAIQIDPKQDAAHLYLADSLANAGRYEAAIPHYLAYLMSAETEPALAQSSAPRKVSVLLRLAHAQSVHDPVGAETSYARALNTAEQTSRPELQSAVLVDEAGAKERSGHPAEALLLFQKAIRLDLRSNDKHGVALDLYNFAIFLQKHGQSDPLAYACLVSAKDLLSKNEANPDEIATVDHRLAEIEKSLGDKAKSIRNSPQPWLEKALILEMNDGR